MKTSLLPGAPHERGNGKATRDDEITERTDYPLEFLKQLRLGLAQIDFSLSEIERRLPGLTPAARRACLFGLDGQFGGLVVAVDAAREVIRDHVGALTLQISDGFSR